jgi:hypothetical protein
MARNTPECELRDVRQRESFPERFHRLLKKLLFEVSS